jgi:type IV pilus assembly protein PilV
MLGKTMISHAKKLKQQNGMMLLEGLIAILIFSLGIIALVGMQAMAVKQVSDAKYRTDASLLANQLIGTMWVGDRTPATLKTNFDTGGTAAGLADWLETVQSTLPGVTADDNQPTVNVTSIGGAGDGTVTITLYWLAPSDAETQAPHKYTTVAQIK